MKNQSKELLPLILLFIVFNNFFLFGKNWLAGYKIDNVVLIIANSLFFIVGLLVYQMQKRAVKKTNPNAFVRMVMGATMIKMLVCFAAVIVYAMAFKNAVSKLTVISIMLLYFFYLFTEVRMTTKLGKKKDG